MPGQIHISVEKSTYSASIWHVLTKGANHRRKCLLTKMTKDWGLGGWRLEVPRRSSCGRTHTILLWTWGGDRSWPKLRSFQLVQNLGAGDVRHLKGQALQILNQGLMTLKGKKTKILSNTEFLHAIVFSQSFKNYSLEHSELVRLIWINTTPKYYQVTRSD